MHSKELLRPCEVRERWPADLAATTMGESLPERRSTLTYSHGVAVPPTGARGWHPDPRLTARWDPEPLHERESRRMSRTVVPRSEQVRGSGGDVGEPLPEKLVKYVPAEVLAFFIPATAAIGNGREGLLWAAILLAAAGTPAYFYVHAQSLSTQKRPRWFFYVLAVISLLAWAVGTSAHTANLLGLDDVAAGFVLTAAVFIVPLVDSLLDLMMPRRP